MSGKTFSESLQVEYGRIVRLVPDSRHVLYRGKRQAYSHLES